MNTTAVATFVHSDPWGGRVQRALLKARNAKSKQTLGKSTWSRWSAIVAATARLWPQADVARSGTDADPYAFHTSNPNLPNRSLIGIRPFLWRGWSDDPPEGVGTCSTSSISRSERASWSPSGSTPGRSGGSDVRVDPRARRRARPRRLSRRDAGHARAVL